MFNIGDISICKHLLLGREGGWLPVRRQGWDNVILKKWLPFLGHLGGLSVLRALRLLLLVGWVLHASDLLSFLKNN